MGLFMYIYMILVAKCIGLKPQDWEVNMKDLEKAWHFGKKNWGYLLDPANWGNDGEQVPEITYNNGAAGAGCSLLTETWEEFTWQGVIRSLENVGKKVVEQPGGESLVDDELLRPQYEMKTNVPLSSQRPSKKQKTIPDLGSGGVAHDHHFMNLESTATRASGSQEAAGDLTHQFLPANHSHYQSNSNPSQLQHSITPRNGIEFFKETMNTLLRSSLFSAECNSVGEFDHFEKAIIERLGKKSVDEAGFGSARLLLVMVSVSMALDF